MHFQLKNKDKEKDKKTPYTPIHRMVMTVCVALGLSKAEKDEMMRIAFPEEEVWDEILEKRMNLIDANMYLKERNLHELGSAEPKEERQEGLSQISYENSPSKKAHKSKGGANPSFLCTNKAYFLSNQATSTSNKATPNRPVSSLLQSLRILYANASRKNCVSVFRFPRVRNLLNP